MNLNFTFPMRFSAEVEWIEKFGMLDSEIGYYVVLRVNDSDIHSWKLSKLDMMTVFHQTKLGSVDGREIREVSLDGLSEFVAAKIGEVFSASERSAVQQ